MSLDRDPYFDIPAFSNSFLSYVYFKLKNKEEPPPLPQAALYFGSQVHYYVLEPHKFTGGPEHIKCGEEIKKLPLIKLLLEFGSIEEELFFEALGVKCKGKMDLRFDNIILDLKTTVANTQEDFENSIIAYNYYRQGAFYMDGANCDKFVIVAVNKTKPKPFIREFNRHDPIIERGRYEYTALLTAAKKHNIYPKNYVL